MGRAVSVQADLSHDVTAHEHHDYEFSGQVAYQKKRPGQGGFDDRDKVVGQTEGRGAVASGQRGKRGRGQGPRGEGAGTRAGATGQGRGARPREGPHRAMRQDTIAANAPLHAVARHSKPASRQPSAFLPDCQFMWPVSSSSTRLRACTPPGSIRTSRP